MVIASILSCAPLSRADDQPILDAYGGWTGITGERTGFFHVEQIDGRHWFITPDGNAFFAVSLSHLLSGESNTACDNFFILTTNG